MTPKIENLLEELRFLRARQAELEQLYKKALAQEALEKK